MATLERTAEAKRLTATLAGGTAVLLWALLALIAVNVVLGVWRPRFSRKKPD